MGALALRRNWSLEANIHTHTHNLLLYDPFYDKKIQDRESVMSDLVTYIRLSVDNLLVEATCRVKQSIRNIINIINSASEIDVDVSNQQLARRCVCRVVKFRQRLPPLP